MSSGLTSTPRSVQSNPPMDSRARKIVDCAVQLAERGGFDAVRLRDVAEAAGVALGTLYNSFRSKEDILVAALEEEVDKLRTVMGQYPVQGESPEARLSWFFALTTRAMLMRPNFARAVLRSVSSGSPEIAEKVIHFHERMTRFITQAMRGGLEEAEPEADEAQVGFLLQQIWFGALVGWMAGVHDEEGVIGHMRASTNLLLAGMRTLRG